MRSPSTRATLPYDLTVVQRVADDDVGKEDHEADDDLHGIPGGSQGERARPSSDGGADITSIGLREGNVTAYETTDGTVTLVIRGLLHELANLATAAAGIQASLKHDGAGALPRAQEELAATADRLFALHADLRSLLPDHEGPTPLDPRAIGADVARLLSWHAERPATVTIADGRVPPILAEAWLARRQLLEACDAAVGSATVFRVTFRTDGETVTALSDDGIAFWSAPSLAAARARD